jgi:hypothetical protein
MLLKRCENRAKPLNLKNFCYFSKCRVNKKPILGLFSKSNRSTVFIGMKPLPDQLA